jgi:hypothetical protein
VLIGIISVTGVSAGAATATSGLLLVMLLMCLFTSCAVVCVSLSMSYDVFTSRILSFMGRRYLLDVKKKNSSLGVNPKKQLFLADSPSTKWDSSAVGRVGRWLGDKGLGDVAPL